MWNNIIKSAQYYGTFVNKNRIAQHFHTSTVLNAKIELTSKRYSVERGNFNSIEESDVSFFRTLLGDHRIISDPSELDGYNTDWLKMVRGASQLLVKPKTTEEVSKILSHCNERNLSVCPQGGNTGLVGGSVPVFDEIIVSTSLMNQIESFDEVSGAIVCQAGCVLENIDQYLAERGMLMPLDLGAKGSCQIGGNVSTNAGGLRVLRYGNLHGSILGVEAVLASGEVVDCMSTMKKDNTGYDLKHLFIGSEGTLGIVTKVAINCPTRPQATSLAFLGVDSFDNVLKTFRAAKSQLAEILSACEFLDNSSMDCTQKNLHLSSPIGEFPHYMLIETSGSNEQHDEEKLTSFLENGMNSGHISDGTVATEPSRLLSMWAIRERLAEALLHEGYVFKYDVSIPLKNFYEIVELIRDRVGDNVIRCCGYGHVGDGNLHLNITVPDFDDKIMKMIEPYLYELVSERKGSISAEHGLGFKKKNYMSYSKSDGSINLMKQIKLMMDPKGILNPYKVLPEH